MVDVCVPRAAGARIAFDAAELERAGGRVLIADDPGEPHEGDFIARIAALRNRLKDAVAAPFWLSADADTHLTGDLLHALVAWLLWHPDWSGVGAWPWPGGIDETAHIGAACALHRTRDTRGFRYGTTLDGERACECAVFTYSLRRAGLIYRYHPTLRVAHG